MVTKRRTKRRSKRASKTKSVAALVTAKPAQEAYRVSKVYTSPKSIPIAELPADYSRADLEFIRIDHSGASYEGRVFLNNPGADENTPTVEETGYAGSFYIFGHGGCFGDVGHCEVNGKKDAFDPRPSHPLEPIRKVVIATAAIKRAAAQSKEIGVTVVPIVVSWTEQTDLTNVMNFDHINLVAYD